MSEVDTCVACGDDVDDSRPLTRLGDGRQVCDPGCALELLTVDAVRPDGGCPVCGQPHRESRVPSAPGYSAETCARCAREIEQRAPRRSRA